jgi:N-acetylglucosamine kinase-like BadF-type ATPase
MNSAETKTFKIGVDGGATKTELILVDGTGAVIARQTAPGSNPSLIGPDRACAVLRDALRSLVAGIPPGRIDRLLLCMAGSQSFWEETAAELGEFGRAEAFSDSLPVLELATGGAPGLVVHAGTGSFVAARAPDGSIHYAGGLGWRFGDPGSGHDLGSRGLAQSLLEHQGWAERSALGAALAEEAGTTDYVVLSRLFYSAPDADARIAAFAPRVVELAARGCQPAQRIIAESVAGFAPLVHAVLQRLFPETVADAPVAGGISGALLNRPPCLEALRALAAVHAWPVRWRPVTDPPIEGVRRMLQRSP